MAKYAGNLITLGLLLLGWVVMVTPLALWVAWSETVLLILLAACAAAAVLCCVLVHFEKPAGSAEGEVSADGRPARLPDKIIAELQGLHPFIHHHRPSGGPKFRRAMDRLKSQVHRRPD